MSQLKYWVWLSSLDGVGAVAAYELINHFGTPEKVFFASAEEYRTIGGIRPTVISALMDKNLDKANKYLATCSELGFRVFTLQDAEYPARLRNIYDPPILIYVRGSLPSIDDEPVVAIVGTRKSSPYGYKAAESFGYHLAQNGLIVSTGLAKGVDTAAAKGALRGGGRVIGVIGSGLDVIYPSENKALFNDVASSGAIISEYPPGMPALAMNFPARNRLISGVSLGVAVIEAPKKSGALITATRALEQGRDVFSLPGNVGTINSEGSNRLLREGAIPILSGDDIVSEYAELFPTIITNYGKKQGAKKDIVRGNGEKEIDNELAVEYIDLNKILEELDGDERIVAQTLGSSAMLADDIALDAEIPVMQVLTALTMLEIKGYAVRDRSYYSLLKGGE